MQVCIFDLFHVFKDDCASTVKIFSQVNVANHNCAWKPKCCHEERVFALKLTGVCLMEVAMFVCKRKIYENFLPTPCGETFLVFLMSVHRDIVSHNS